jgi:hypothetical protein
MTRDIDWIADLPLPFDHAYPSDLADLVLRRWDEAASTGRCDLTRPDAASLTAVLSTCYQATLLHEEGRPVTFRLAWQPAFVPDARHLEAAKQFSAPRFAVLEKVWRLHGDDVIWNTYSKGIEDQFDLGRAAVEFTVIQRQYLHVAHLVGVA